MSVIEQKPQIKGDRSQLGLGYYILGLNELINVSWKMK